MLPALKAKYRLLHRIWADSGYTGDLVTWAKTKLALVVEIVKRTDGRVRPVVRRRAVTQQANCRVSAESVVCDRGDFAAPVSRDALVGAWLRELEPVRLGAD